MRTISTPAQDAARLKDVLAAFGRRRSLRDPMAAACEELDLTPAQIHALLWLRLDGPLTMGELARRLGTSMKTFTGIADRLVARRLVQRERDDHDRRVVRCKLTKTGAREADKLDEATTVAMEMLLGLIEPADRDHLIRILENLQQRMQKAALETEAA
jgi:DNA-binding MarR family transcriptional regulator